MYISTQGCKISENASKYVHTYIHTYIHMHTECSRGLSECETKYTGYTRTHTHTRAFLSNVHTPLDIT